MVKKFIRRDRASPLAMAWHTLRNDEGRVKRCLEAAARTLGVKVHYVKGDNDNLGVYMWDSHEVLIWPEVNSSIMDCLDTLSHELIHVLQWRHKFFPVDTSRVFISESIQEAARRSDQRVYLKDSYSKKHGCLAVVEESEAVAELGSALVLRLFHLPSMVATDDVLERFPALRDVCIKDGVDVEDWILWQAQEYAETLHAYATGSI